MNHLTLGIYADGTYKYNVVAEKDLQSHIEYNETWRPGRLLYVDGKRVYNGCFKEKYLSKYDDIAKKFYDENSVNISNITTPYK